MRLYISSPGFTVVHFLLFRWSHLESLVQAAALQTSRGIERRYYHHEVHLDENKHNDEFFSFVTRPDLDAPKWDIVLFQEQALSPGYWFSAPYSDAFQSTADAPWNAPHIYDGNGDLVWSGASLFDGFTTFDFRVINIQGQAMLSLVFPRGGKAYIFDDAYRIHKIIDMGHEELREDQIALNSHEFTTTTDGTRALYLTRLPKRTSRENSRMINFNEECFAIFDGLRELDTEDWNVTHVWNSEAFIGLDESYADVSSIEDRCAAKDPWDFFHANSIDVFPNGDYLVSGRRTNTIYRISRDSGAVAWRLGGRKSDFPMPFEFSGQHAARIYNHNDTHTIISLLDNAFLPPARPQTTNHQSRGLLLVLDTTAMTVEAVSRYPHPEGRHTASRGNMQMLPSTNAWICWADGSLQSEHAFDGSLLMKSRFKAEISSYRTYKFPWTGRPHYPPDVHAAIVEKNGLWYTIVHMSWNGATEVKEWKIYQTGTQGEEGKLLATAPRRGFETVVWTEGYSEYVVAQAIDKDGVALGMSQIFSSLPPHNRTQLVSLHLHSADQPWRKVMRHPPVVFVGGVFLGVFVAMMTLRIVKRCMSNKYELSPASGARAEGAYEPLMAERSADSEKLEMSDAFPSHV